VLKLAEALHLRRKQPEINYIATADFRNLMDLADFEVIGQEQRQLLPRRWLGLGRSSTDTSRRCRGSGSCACGPISSAPGPPFSGPEVFREHSHSCRNEKGNIENAILRMPRFGSAQEVLFRRGELQRWHLRGMRACSRKSGVSTYTDTYIIPYNSD